MHTSLHPSPILMVNLLKVRWVPPGPLSMLDPLHHPKKLDHYLPSVPNLRSLQLLRRPLPSTLSVTLPKTNAHPTAGHLPTMLAHLVREALEVMVHSKTVQTRTTTLVDFLSHPSSHLMILPRTLQ